MEQQNLEYEKLIDSICYENNQKYKLFIYYKNESSKDKHILLINHISDRFSKIVDFYDISEYFSNDTLFSFEEMMILKDDKNKTILFSEKINEQIIERYFQENF